MEQAVSGGALVRQRGGQGRGSHPRPVSKGHVSDARNGIDAGEDVRGLGGEDYASRQHRAIEGMG